MQVSIRQVIKDYIGGGWGKESPDRDHFVPAFVIRGTDLDAVQSGNASVVPFRYHKESNARSRTLTPGDIVFEVSGGSKDQPVGRSLLLDVERLRRFKSAVIPASFCKKIRPDHEVVHARFLLAHFQLAWSDRRIVQWQVQSTGISNFNFEAFLIELPPLPVQQRIAGILSAYDELIENSHRRIKILEAMAHALYREWFISFRFPGHEGHPFVASSLGEIPKGWEVRTLPECVHINPRVTVPREGQKPFVPMGCLSNGLMLITDIESREGNSGAKFQNGDTLFARITPCLENGKTGFVQFLPDARAVAFGSTEFIVLRSHDLTPEYVYCLARSDEFRGVAIKSMSGATGRQRVQERCFDDIQLAQPPSEVLDQFSMAVAPSFRLIYKLHLQIENLRRTRDLLLPRLLSGQINVEVA